MSLSQNKLVLRHLRKGLTLTPLIALREYGILRLAARVYDLRGQGINVITDRVETSPGVVVARYRLGK